MQVVKHYVLRSINLLILFRINKMATGVEATLLYLLTKCVITESLWSRNTELYSTFFPQGYFHTYTKFPCSRSTVGARGSIVG
jgi:hypothetical protein